MSWRDLLTTDTSVSAPWFGGRTLRLGVRSWNIQGKLPNSPGWFSFSTKGRVANFLGPTEPHPDCLIDKTIGYLVGDRLVTFENTKGERVLLIDPNVGRFALVSAGRPGEDLPLVFIQEEMPLGPESDVESAYLDGSPIDGIKDVTPALHSAFNLAVWQREMAEERRQKLEEERRRQEARERLRTEIGNGAIRREVAAVDFEAAARAALRVTGCVYLEHQHLYAGEVAVRFRIPQLGGRRFECTCDSATLQIIDSGCCLTAHDESDGFEYGTKGDTWFTLESLPSVIMNADRLGRLVVYRHV